MQKFIYALGIRQIGTATALLIAKNYISFENFKTAMQNEDIQKLLSIDGIGEAMAKDIVEFFKEEHNLKIVDKLLQYVTVKDYEQQEISNSVFADKTIVFTGTLENLTRAEAKALGVKLGAKVAGSVSNNTDYVIVGSDTGSKAKKALELGVKILNEAEFLNLIQTK